MSSHDSGTGDGVEKKPSANKKVFAPSIPQRRVSQGQSLLVSAARNDATEGRGGHRGARGATRGTRGRGAARGTASSFSSSMTASGPFSLGPGMRDSRSGFGGAGLRIGTALGSEGSGFSDGCSSNSSTSNPNNPSNTPQSSTAASSPVPGAPSPGPVLPFAPQPFDDVAQVLGYSDDVPQVLPPVPQLPAATTGDHVVACAADSADFPHRMHLLQLPPFALPVATVHGDSDDPNQPDSGMIGNLIVRQSGKTELIIGDIRFDVSLTPKFTFYQQVVAIDPSANHAFALGEVDSMFVCSPNLDCLLRERENEIRNLAL